MKNYTKIISIILSALLIVFAFAGCATTPGKSDDAKTVGIIQLMAHNSLDNCTNGIKQALDAAGIAYDVQIGSSTSPVDDCQSYAATMAASGKYSALIAVATPAATAAYSAVQNNSADIPVIFCAVSDPVSAGLAKSLEEPGNKCTGTSDAFDIPAQVKLIKALQPNAKNLGVIYTTTEANSISQLKTLKEEAAKVGLNIVDQGINEVAELASAVAALLPKVDAVTNLTDNNVVDNMGTLLEQAAAAKIPVYGSEIEQVKKGCVASASLDYVALGKTTGDMAVKVLNGTDASTLPVSIVSDSFLVANTDVLNTLGIELSGEYADIEKVTTVKE